MCPLVADRERFLSHAHMTCNRPIIKFRKQKQGYLSLCIFALHYCELYPAKSRVQFHMPSKVLLYVMPSQTPKTVRDMLPNAVEKREKSRDKQEGRRNFLCNATRYILHPHDPEALGALLLALLLHDGDELAPDRLLLRPTSRR